MSWTGTLLTAPEPLVSVIVNNYNHERYVGQAIDSALGQSWPRTEVIIVDDGSTDRSREVIAGYGDRIRVVLKENGGQTSALNAGLPAAHGDLVAFLDADDVLHADMLERAVGAFRTVPAAAMCQFRMRAVDANLAPVGSLVPPVHVQLVDGDAAADVRSWRVASGFAPTSGLVFARPVLQVLMPLPVHRFAFGPDFPLVRGAALLGPIVGIDEMRVDYRSHGGNDSHRQDIAPDKLRASIRRSFDTAEFLAELTTRLGLPVLEAGAVHRDPILVSQRLASLRLDRGAHPVPGDTRRGLATLGLRAVAGRRDLGTPARVVHGLWFLFVAAAPGRLAILAATLLLHPLSRGRWLAGVDRLLSRFSPRARHLPTRND